MSNGDPPPVSASSYIIICNGRIERAAAANSEGEIVAASRCAAQLCSFIESNAAQFDPSDCHQISVLQHELMDHVMGTHHLTPARVTEKVDQLFAEFDELEDKY